MIYNQACIFLNEKDQKVMLLKTIQWNKSYNLIKLKL